MVEIVNVVSSGSLGLELDLSAVSRDLGDIAEYDPEKYPGAYVHLDEDTPLITLYRTGKYIITGADSEGEAETTREEFLSTLTRCGILSEPDDQWFDIQNYVCTADVGEQLNLSALAIGLGLEVTEYEPEQFPGLVYRPSEHDCVLLVFGSGQVVITGATDIEYAEQAFSDLQTRIEDLF
ncbi:TATA-box-binding protein [Halorubrum vacuolatum]|uniref:TATA-box-binding protein n=1 Tax=Halorubrum vacuolatum TaxID=63740 RepID=A0A238XCA2_HALVU|nr:TATA-box-binding protein [Halorubrum vacuolatum]SNR56597.1 TATA binding protein of transcription factor TFIID [Halorubrum vacuolatum]